MLFDIPVTVTIVYADGRSRDEVIPVTAQRVEWKTATDGVVKQVVVNRDYAAVAVFEPQSGTLAAVTKRVKDGFDPKGVLNPGRMWAGV